ncbi:DNA repair protein RAD51 homolog 4 isoform X1 [Pezoporus wallicus]|uniref:DNA repair protein RAD51 homolog 4 isoform X1 n=1 Tax=Pezoporus wallicus TaxID=35540 RepID=UPI0025510E46|nr:DNA repair protein RAD51 homolog 4 isoform X1 [Pezoporus wallicus]
MPAAAAAPAPSRTPWDGEASSHPALPPPHEAFGSLPHWKPHSWLAQSSGLSFPGPVALPAGVPEGMVVLRAGLCPGLTEEMIQLLRANSIQTVVDFVSSDLEDVAQKCSLSYKALAAVRRVLLAQFSAFPANGADLYEELKSSTAILPTGSPSLDQLLDSGLYTGEVTELMGAPGSGKTQVCLGIAASVSLGLKQHVLFLDSTGGFTASRLYQMLRAQEEEEQASSPELSPPFALDSCLQTTPRDGLSFQLCLVIPMGFFGSTVFLLWFGGCCVQAQTLHFRCFSWGEGENLLYLLTLLLHEHNLCCFFHQCHGDKSIHGVEANAEEIMVPGSIV